MKLDDQSLSKALHTALATLDFELKKLEARGYPRELLVQFIARRLGVGATASPSPREPQSKLGDRRAVMDALRTMSRDAPSGALLPIRELRTRSGLGKREFDDAALSLARDGEVVLHHHDAAASLSESDRYVLVSDQRGTHYVGIALPLRR